MIEIIGAVLKLFLMFFQDWQRKDVEKQAQRKMLKEEVANAIKTGNTDELHRIMSRL